MRFIWISTLTAAMAFSGGLLALDQFEPDVQSGKRKNITFQNKSKKDIYLRCKNKRRKIKIFVKSNDKRKKSIRKGKWSCKCAKKRDKKSYSKFKFNTKEKKIHVGKKCKK